MKVKPGESVKKAVTRGKSTLTIAIAESCTGGLVSDMITDVAGSSNYFLGSVVAYGNNVKRELLGVKAATLKRHGAVSPETAAQMARCIKKRLKSAVGVAITGIAGPTGGSPQKPVGTVWIAVAFKNRCIARKLLFKGGRRAVKRQSALAAIRMIEQVLV